MELPALPAGSFHALIVGVTVDKLAILAFRVRIREVEVLMVCGTQNERARWPDEIQWFIEKASKEFLTDPEQQRRFHNWVAKVDRLKKELFLFPFPRGTVQWHPQDSEHGDRAIHFQKVKYERGFQLWPAKQFIQILFKRSPWLDTGVKANSMRSLQLRHGAYELGQTAYTLQGRDGKIETWFHALRPLHMFCIIGGTSTADERLYWIYNIFQWRLYFYMTRVIKAGERKLSDADEAKWQQWVEDDSWPEEPFDMTDKRPQAMEYYNRTYWKVINAAQTGS
eukprot:2479785-Rhodomonas_salina.1